MDNKYFYIIFGVLLLLLAIIVGLYFVKFSGNFQSNEGPNIYSGESSNVSSSIPVNNTGSVVASSSGGKLTPVDISKKVDIANNSKKVPIANNSNNTIIGTNNTVTAGQDVINIEDMKRWCINGSSMNYNKVPNSNEWVVSGTVIYSGAGYCFAKKTGSQTSYLFNEEYEIVYSVTIVGRDLVYTLV